MEANAGLRIVPEQPGDEAAIYAVERAAFGRPGEADLVDALRAQGAVTLSLVARLEGEVVGHVLFSPLNFEPPLAAVKGAGLGPVAVAPDHQGRGIGAELIRRGLETLRLAGYDLVALLGSPAYYARFGFRPAQLWGAHCKFPAPPEDFMMVELTPEGLRGWQGLVQYHPFFDEIT